MTGNGRRPAQARVSQAAAPPASTIQRCGLLARELGRCRVENARAGYLRGDQKGRNHGRYADKSQELIYGNHVRRPPRISRHRQTRPHPSERQNLTATVCPWLVRIWSEITAPEIVSSARIVITVMVRIWLRSLRIVAESV
jgi:hypothetical protein